MGEGGKTHNHDSRVSVSPKMTDPEDPDLSIPGFIGDRIDTAQPVLHFSIEVLYWHCVERRISLFEVVRGEGITLEVDGDVVLFQ